MVLGWMGVNALLGDVVDGIGLWALQWLFSGYESREMGKVRIVGIVAGVCSP